MRYRPGRTPGDSIAADRLESALHVADSAPCSDEQTQRLVETCRMLAPSLQMSLAGRRLSRRRMLAAFDGPTGAAVTSGSGSLDGSAADHLAAARVVDVGGLGMVTLSDVEPIDQARAEAACREIAVILALADRP